MPRAVFVDTAGWMAMADRSDAAHAESVRFRDDWMESGGILLSTDFVMDETLTLLRLRLGIDVAEQWWNLMEASPRVVWEWIDPQRAEKARRWLFRWRDKEFSFTDCTSFVVMRERRLRVALTSDRHFAQAGFETVPAMSARRSRK